MPDGELQNGLQLLRRHDMTDINEDIQNENETLRNENCELSMKLECAENELEETADLLREERSSRAALEAEIAELRERISDFEMKSATLRREIGCLNGKNAALRRDIEELRGEKEGLRGKNEELSRGSSGRHRNATRENSADEAGKLRQTAKDLTNDMQFRMINALNDCRTELINSLRDWQVSLFRHEYGRLAAAFVNLAVISSSLANRALMPGTPDEVRAVSARIGQLRARFAAAMEDAGLRVVDPAPGDPFDPALHSASDTDGDGDDHGHELRIQSVESPGVILMTGSDEPPEVLIEASVTVKRTDKHDTKG